MRREEGGGLKIKINGTFHLSVQINTTKNKNAKNYLQVGYKVHNCKCTPLPKTNQLFLCSIMKAERNKVTSI